MLELKHLLDVQKSILDVHTPCVPVYIKNNTEVFQNKIR